MLLSTRREARIDAWDLDAEVAVDEHDRLRLEHLARYLLRPPLALDRLRLLGQDYVCLALKRPWADRTTHVTMSASTLLGRLASLVPRPRANTILYFGVLAANANDRDTIVPRGTAARARPDSSWAALMRHSFGIDVLACPRCGDAKFGASSSTSRSFTSCPPPPREDHPTNTTPSASADGHARVTPRRVAPSPPWAHDAPP